MASSLQKTVLSRLRLKGLSAVFCGAALVAGLTGCNPKPEQKQPEPPAPTQTLPAPANDPEPQQPPVTPTLTCPDYRAGIKHESRGLTPGEAKLAKALFGDGLDLRCTRLEFFPEKNGRVETAEGELYHVEIHGKTNASPDYSREGRSKFGLFVTAMTFLWQNQHTDQWQSDSDGSDYDLDGDDFTSYGWEQQTAIMEDYALRFLHPSRHSRWLSHGYGGDRSDTDPALQDLVENQFPSARDAREAFANIETRSLVPGEEALLRSIFGDALDTSGVKSNFHPENFKDIVGSVNSSDGAQFWGPDEKSADFSTERDADRFGTFVHEYTHVWQFQKNFRFTVDDRGEESDPKDELSKYKYPLEKKYSFANYGVEQQAAIIEDYARRFLHPSHSWTYLPEVYGRKGAAARDALLQKVVEDQFSAAKEARLSFGKPAGQVQPRAKVASLP